MEALFGEHRDSAREMAGRADEQNRGRSDEPFGSRRILISVSRFGVDHRGRFWNAETDRPTLHFCRFFGPRTEDSGISSCQDEGWSIALLEKIHAAGRAISGIGRGLSGRSKRTLLVDASPQDYDGIETIGRRELRGLVPGFKRAHQKGRN